MKKIQEFDWKYSLLKFYVRFVVRQFYGEISVLGLENIPKDKSVILAPNHQNALMDALAILLARPGQPVFLARADIFKQKIITRILYIFNILPVYRIRDGRNELDKNQKIFDKSVDVLKDGVELCLMPEGQQSFRRTLLPLVKGMFRIAFKAQQESGKDIVIVPVGIDYEDYIKPGKNWIIRFGEPIEVKSYLPAYEENEAKGLNILRNEVYEGISKLIQNIRSKENYELFYEISKIADNDFCREKGQKTNFINLLEARCTITKKLESKGNNPVFIEKISKSYNSYSEKLKAFKLDDSIVVNHDNYIQILLKSVLFILGFPFFAYGWIVNAIPSYFPQLIVKKLKITDDFKSSFNFVLWLISYPVYYLLIFLILWLVFQSAFASFSFVVGFPIMGKFAFEYRKRFFKFYDNVLFIKAKMQNKYIVKTLINERKEIISYLF